MKNKLPKILITAYAVNPYKGSEDGTGWNMISEIAKYNNVIAITRKNNKPAIEQYLKENDLEQADQMKFEYFDLPYWMRFWKKGGRGALLYFYFWQIGIIFFILKKKIKFDLAHHLNFHNDWTPTFLWLLGKPLIWGPIGHHPAIPKDYLIRSAGKLAYLFDQLKWSVKKLFWSFDPFLKITKWKAKKIITINSSVKSVLNFESTKEVRLPAVAAKIENENHHISNLNTKKKFNVLSIGRFVPLKGFDIAIESFGHFYNRQENAVKEQLQLTLIGKGSQKEVLKKLVEDLGLTASVQFIEWMPKSELHYYFQSSSVFLFPSHEGAGMVVPEALSFNLPVLCFNNIGPGELISSNCGIKVKYTSPRESIVAFSKCLSTFYNSEGILKELSNGAKHHYKENFTWERKGEVISKAYLDVLFPNQKNQIETPIKRTKKLSIA